MAKLCSSCPKIVRSYFRMVWIHKATILTTGIVLYFLAYFTVSTVLSRNGPQVITKKTVPIHGNNLRKHKVIHFPFSRTDLRLSFKPLPYIDPSNPAYDNFKDYPCTQKGITVGVNDTQDLMCMPRPNYMPSFRNPCFQQQESNHKQIAKIHCLPYFHILGNDKCGTTDFHSRLTSHPEILLNNGGIGKEIYYWCWHRYGLWMKRTAPPKKFPAYMAFFHVPSVFIVNQFLKSQQQLITGDGTPMDFWDFRGWKKDSQNAGLSEPKVLTPHVMRHVYKDPRFIVLMRNPVERIYSDYIFLGYGFTAQKFAKDVPAAIAMMRDCLKVNTTRQCFFSDDMYHNLPMRIHISCYSVFLREWLSVFHKRHFLIIRTEDYHNDMAGTLRKAFDFLEVSSLNQDQLEKITSEKIKHETKFKKQAGPMFPETRQLLEEFFAPFNEDLANLLQDERFLWKDKEKDMR